MFGERLKQARLARHMTQQALANACGVSRMAICYYENGKNFPGSDVLLKLARALCLPVNYFFRTITVRLGVPAYRKHCGLSDSALREIECKAKDQVERYLEAETLFPDNLTPRLVVPDAVRETVASLDEVEARADALRSYWGLAHYPIDNLTELLEEHGIRVIYEDVDGGFDGCAYPDGDCPVIVVNGSQFGDRLRFNLAHELGHLLINCPTGSSDEYVEKVAHRFAGAFLSPAQAVRRELGDRRVAITLRELHDLKHKYGMSMAAWIYRAGDLKIINSSTRSKLFELVKMYLGGGQTRARKAISEGIYRQTRTNGCPSVCRSYYYTEPGS